MGKFVAQKTIKMMLKNKIDLTSAKVGIYGITFKENVPDIRNSKVHTIISELKEYGVVVEVYDPLANAKEVSEEYSIELTKKENMLGCDALILAVPHQQIFEEDNDIFGKGHPVVVDVKSVLDESPSSTYWSL